MSPSLLDMPHDAQSQRAIPIVTDEVAKSNLLCPFYALALVFGTFMHLFERQYGVLSFGLFLT